MAGLLVPQMPNSSQPPRKGGRPPQGGVGTQVQVRLKAPWLAAVDAAGADKDLRLGNTRPEIIRAILEDWLRGHGFAPIDGNDQPPT